jgi:hypothetical protein
MNAGPFDFDTLHPMGGPATRPIAWLARRIAALFLLAENGRARA